MVYAIIAFIVYSICYLNTEERVTETKKESKDDKLGFIAGLKLLSKNKYWAILTFNGIFSSAVIALNMGSMYYYLAYVCNSPDAIVGVGMLVSIPMLFLIPLSQPFVDKFGMKNSLILGNVVMVLGRAVVGIFGSSYVIAIYIGSLLFSIGCCTAWCSYPLLCNTVEYGEWKNGRRQEGLIMSAQSFGSKCGTAVGTALCGWVLAIVGYDGSAAIQSTSALKGITLLYIVLPIILNILGAIVLSFYNLEKEYPAIVKELEERHQAAETV
ncbi:MFS/sugar transport protein [Lachnospiraceae bacterium C7]|nr:MFS/sugar transport protein [Lachnospiraceae bacterium C7]